MILLLLVCVFCDVVISSVRPPRNLVKMTQEDECSDGVDEVFGALLDTDTERGTQDSLPAQSSSSQEQTVKKTRTSPKKSATTASNVKSRPSAGASAATAASANASASSSQPKSKQSSPVKASGAQVKKLPSAASPSKIRRK